MKRTAHTILLALLFGTAAAAELADITVEAVVDGLATPLAVTHVGDGRLFVSQLGGQVRIVENAALRATPFLDISDRIRGQGLGLYSIAFHPEHAANGWLFAHYTEKDTGDSIIARYRVSDDDPDVVDLASEAILLRIAKTGQLHYGGQLDFGPDGYLYVSTGDTTGQGTSPDPLCAAQSLDSLEGKILRLDVDVDPDTPPFHGVPPDNPFVESGRAEIWAYGLRNPWRFSFDRATGDLWISDVGQDRREEVSLQPAAGGGENYGWKVTEGTRCSANRAGCGATVPNCGDEILTDPVIEYSHSGGRCSVTGGYVYRGSRIPELDGHYLYGDFCSGEVWAAAWNGNRWVPRKLAFELPGLTSFGEDADGEIWLTASGTLYRLLDPTVPDGGPCVADANHLCLTGGRFRVSLSWRTDTGATGLGTGVSLGEDAGMFWFFSANNPEVFVKVLDACFDPFQHFWVFAAGLTNVETSLRVVDTATGQSRSYDRPLGTLYEAVSDTRAFSTCP